MVVEAYVLIRSAPEADHGRKAAWIRELEAIPEVDRLRRVLGEYDLMATLVATANAIGVADMIRANRCVERVAVCRIEAGSALSDFRYREELNDCPLQEARRQGSVPV